MQALGTAYLLCLAGGKIYSWSFNTAKKMEEKNICHCPKLKERCAKGTGAEWSNIAHIPSITIDSNRIKNEVI